MPLFLQVSPPSVVPGLNTKHLRTGTAAVAFSTQHREMHTSFIKVLGTILNNGGVGSCGRRKAHKPLLYAQIPTSQSAGRGKQGYTTILNLILRYKRRESIFLQCGFICRVYMIRAVRKLRSIHSYILWSLVFLYTDDRILIQEQR